LSVQVPIFVSCREATTTHRRQPDRTGNRVPSARDSDSESEPQMEVMATTYGNPHVRVHVKVALGIVLGW